MRRVEEADLHVGRPEGLGVRGEERDDERQAEDIDQNNQKDRQQR
jgi:hypothetical protein